MKLEEVARIGPKTASLFKKLHVTTVEELVKFYPYKYQILKRSDIKLLGHGAKVIIDGIIEGQPMLLYFNNKPKKIIFMN